MKRYIKYYCAKPTITKRIIRVKQQKLLLQVKNIPISIDEYLNKVILCNYIEITFHERNVTVRVSVRWDRKEGDRK